MNMTRTDWDFYFADGGTNAQIPQDAPGVSEAVDAEAGDSWFDGLSDRWQAYVTAWYLAWYLAWVQAKGGGS